jgi:hypothetical protein
LARQTPKPSLVVALAIDVISWFCGAFSGFVVLGRRWKNRNLPEPDRGTGCIAVLFFEAMASVN